MTGQRVARRPFIGPATGGKDGWGWRLNRNWPLRYAYVRSLRKRRKQLVTIPAKPVSPCPISGGSCGDRGVTHPSLCACVRHPFVKVHGNSRFRRRRWTLVNSETHIPPNPAWPIPSRARAKPVL